MTIDEAIVQLNELANRRKAYDAARGRGEYLSDWDELASETMREEALDIVLRLIPNHQQVYPAFSRAYYLGDR
jgi:hypothetical protein